ncbi:MAG: phage tail sheath subtilisin-like domain-containing protein [Prevotella sp.]|jgi:phage tail sheath protein FI|nr:phage tail sheath subtilisin-like domain-containing protein [Prevotella sp.]MCH4211629.1 phage tail sheath subtilisin-like domain-containing protein [Prevotella sp.]MCH4240857.1 phage tail sheath subtilisin-like domain-containing protein [Prevotella sp.]
MATMKTPGVYIVEKSAFPNSVVEAPTAIPAFIGITEKALNGADSLSGKPWKITSMTEFQQYFGGAPIPKFTLSVTDMPTDGSTDNTNDSADNTSKPFYSIPSLDKKKILKVDRPKILYSLYYQMIMFFANGGGTCYIVSIGTYENSESIDKDNVGLALAALEKEQEITMVVVPEAVSTLDYKDIQTQMLAHCGKMKNRFAIFDVQPKDGKEMNTIDQQIKAFRTNIGANFLSYGAVYYPWLNTSVLSDKDIDGTVLEWKSDSTLEDFFPKDSPFPNYFKGILEQINPSEQAAPQTPNDSPGKAAPQTPNDSPEQATPLTPDERIAMKNDLHNALLQNFPGYQCIVKKVKDTLNLLPPSAAMAGLYTMIDNTRGVWKAPANISINYVNSPTENIDNAIQEDLNMPMNGKAVNAIRTFPGEGIKVWGARTLDGNSEDWRYVNVRRTMIFLEESVKNAAKAYVFEPNVANTWMNVKSMIDNFLRSVWKRGGLAGATPEEAYEIHIGLGDTMTGNDILDGIMRITVLVAITHPAEFIEITFQQQMQKS